MRIGTERIEDEDCDTDVHHVEHGVGEVLDQVDPAPRPAGEQHPGDVAAEQLMRIDEEETHRHRDLGEGERRDLAMDAHLHEQQARRVAGGELDPPRDRARSVLIRCTSCRGMSQTTAPIEPEDDREDHKALRAVEPAEARPCARHEQRWAGHRHLAHITPFGRVPLITGDLLSVHMPPPAEWLLDCVGTTVPAVHGGVTAW